MTLVNTYGELQNGDVIHIAGFAFEVCNVRRHVHVNEKDDLIRFEGRLTADQRNNAIRFSGYNGGTYGAYASVSCYAERERA